MPNPLPKLYFRVKDRGVLVFRIDSENRHKRIEMQHIAAVNFQNGIVRTHKNCQLSAAEETAIQSWLNKREKVSEERRIDDIFRTIDHLNMTAQWAQTQASDTQLEQVSGELLLAMHDLRRVLVEKQAKRIAGKDKNKKLDEK